MRKILLGMLVLVPSARSAELFVVGDHFISFFDGTALTSVSLETRSWAFDANGCRLLAHQPSTQTVRTFLRGLQPDQAFDSGPILTETTRRLITWDTSQKNLQERDPGGVLQAEHPAPWVKGLLGIVRAGETDWALQVTAQPDRLWLNKLGADLQSVQERRIPAGRDIFSTQKLFFDAITATLWLGFSATTAQHAYGPHLTRLSSEGEPVQTTTWREKGLFLDVCSRNGKVFVSREEPSESGWTVPIVSHFERLDEAGHATQMYTGEPNYFLDSMACADLGVYFTERSFYPSGMDYLSYWDEKEGKALRLATLPDEAKDIFLCE